MCPWVCVCPDTHVEVREQIQGLALTIYLVEADLSFLFLLHSVFQASWPLGSRLTPISL